MTKQLCLAVHPRFDAVCDRPPHNGNDAHHSETLGISWEGDRATERVNRPGDQLIDPQRLIEEALCGGIYEQFDVHTTHAEAAERVLAEAFSPVLAAKDAKIEQLRQDVIEERQHRDFLWWLYAEAAWKRDEAERERDVARVAAGSAYQRADEQTKATIDCVKKCQEKCQAAEGLAAQAGKAEELLTARVAELTRERGEARAFAEEWSRTGAAMPSPAEWNTVVRQRDEAFALLHTFADPSPCHHDHHGHCQEHGWLEEGECNQKRLAEFLAESGRPVTQEAPAPAQAGEPPAEFVDRRPTDADDYGQDYEGQAHALGLPEPDEVVEPRRPRVWQKGDPEPPDRPIVIGSDGSVLVFTRNGFDGLRPEWWCIGTGPKKGVWCTWRSWLAKIGPLTEVLPESPVDLGSMAVSGVLRDEPAEVPSGGDPDAE